MCLPLTVYSEETVTIVLLLAFCSLHLDRFNLLTARVILYISFSRDNFMCRLLFGVRSTSVLPQWHLKDPGHSVKSASGRLDLNTHTPLTQVKSE